MEEVPPTKKKLVWFLESTIKLLENEKIYSDEKRKARLDRGITIAQKLLRKYHL